MRHLEKQSAFYAHLVTFKLRLMDLEWDENGI